MFKINIIYYFSNIYIYNSFRGGVTVSIVRFQGKARTDRGSIPRLGTYFLALSFLYLTS